ncbi:unnamed protein product [Pedinophyceae sp. YPF-701]|nr:unnamed protein product [Pedinophyceae sp. YPF-701]
MATDVPYRPSTEAPHMRSMKVVNIQPEPLDLEKSAAPALEPSIEAALSGVAGRSGNSSPVRSISPDKKSRRYEQIRSQLAPKRMQVGQPTVRVANRISEASGSGPASAGPIARNKTIFADYRPEGENLLGKDRAQASTALQVPTNLFAQTSAAGDREGGSNAGGAGESTTIRWKARGVCVKEVRELPPEFQAGVNASIPLLTSSLVLDADPDAGADRPAWNKSTQSELYPDPLKPPAKNEAQRVRYGRWYMPPDKWEAEPAKRRSVWDDSLISLNHRMQQQSLVKLDRDQRLMAEMLGVKVADIDFEMSRLVAREQQARKNLRGLYSSKAYREYLQETGQPVPAYLEGVDTTDGNAMAPPRTGQTRPPPSRSGSVLDSSRRL